METSKTIVNETYTTTKQNRKHRKVRRKKNKIINKYSFIELTIHICATHFMRKNIAARSYISICF